MRMRTVAQAVSVAPHQDATRFRSSRHYGRFVVLLLLSCLLGPASPNALGQSLTSLGDWRFAAPEPVELGFVESANGGLHQEIRLGSFPQRGGRTLTATLVYDSTIWTVVGSTWTPTNMPNNTRPWQAWGGWRFITSADVGTVSNTFSSHSCSGGSYWQRKDFLWKAPDGTVRYFPITTTQPMGCGSNVPSGNAYAIDSSGYRMYVTNYSTATIYAPDGTQVYPVLKDTNGNYFSVDASGHSNVIDTLGRIPVTYVPAVSGCPTNFCFDILNSQGSTFRVQVTTQTINVRTAFGQQGVTEYNGTITVITRIDLPDGTNYQFEYDSGTSPGYYGLLKKVTLPTGGQVTYGFNTFADSYGIKGRWVSYRISANSMTTYTPQVISTCTPQQVNCQQKLTVTAPTGEKNVYTFQLNNGVWPIQIQNYDGATGNLLSTVTKTYDTSIACPLQNCVGASYVRLLSERTTLPVSAGGSITKKVEFIYQSYLTGLVTATKEWKFYPGTSPSFPTTPDKATYVAYHTTGTNNINRPSSAAVCNNTGSDASCPGGGIKVAHTLVTYDSYGANGLASVTGTSNHDDLNFGTANTARGNPTHVQKWVSGTSFLTTQFSYDTTGQMIQRTDPVGNVTGFSYTDNFFNDNGADPPAAFTPPTPTNAYLTQVTFPIGTQSFGYYYGNGKRAISTDPNGASEYAHFVDALDRPTSVKSPKGWMLTDYTAANQVDTYTAVSDAVPSTGCTGCRHTRSLYDSWGRKTSLKLVNSPGGIISADAFYDPKGRIQAASRPYTNPAGPEYAFETTTYDGLGRAVRTVRADGQYMQSFFGALASVTGGLSAQLGATATYGHGYPALMSDEARKQKQHWFDGFGRLIEVDEPDPTGGSGAATISGKSVGSVNITGWEQYVEEGEWVWDCVLWWEEGICLQWDWVWVVTTYWDSGNVSVTVNGLTKSANYGQGSAGATIASALATAINADANYPVTASTAGAVLYLTSKIPGSGTNYSLSASSSTSDPAHFSSPSFVPVPSGSSLTGGGAGAPVGTFYKYDVLGNLTQVIQGCKAGPTHMMALAG